MACAWCLWYLSASFVSCLSLLRWRIRKIELRSRLSADELETASKVEQEVPTGKGRYLRIMLVTTRRWMLYYSSPWLTLCAYLTGPLLRCTVDKQLQQNRKHGEPWAPGWFNAASQSATLHSCFSHFLSRRKKRSCKRTSLWSITASQSPGFFLLKLNCHELFCFYVFFRIN